MPAVYTRTGDRGETGLFGGARVAKQSVRVEAYGAVDEANSAIGAAKALMAAGRWRERVHAMQLRLFVVAAELASDARGVATLDDLVGADDVSVLERLIDDCLEITGPQRAFVVPGRDPVSAAFHLARTVVRRSERRVLTLAEGEPVRPELVKYLNRLSDAVYSLARLHETWFDRTRVEAAVRKVVGELSGQSGVRADRPASGRLDMATAKALAEAAEARAASMGVPIVFAACDEAGNQILLHRMADSLLASIEIAVNKAWSAVAFKMGTDKLGEVADDSLRGLSGANSGRNILFGGGEPVFVAGRLVGGVGVSGGSVAEDIEILRHAIGRVMGESR